MLYLHQDFHIIEVQFSHPTPMLLTFNFTLFPKLDSWVRCDWHHPCSTHSLTSLKEEEGDLLLLREAITGSNKGIELNSREAIFGCSLPLAVHLLSLKWSEGARRAGGGVTFSEVSSAVPLLYVSFLIAKQCCLSSANMGPWRWDRKDAV